MIVTKKKLAACCMAIAALATCAFAACGTVATSESASETTSNSVSETTSGSESDSVIDSANSSSDAETEHNYAMEWSHDDSTHWHACTDEGYETLKADEAAHTWDEGTVTKEAGFDEAGERTFTCTVCGKSKTEEIAALEHTYATEWSHDDSTHWHACTDEGYETLKADEAAHMWDEGTVTKEAGFGEAGERTFTCTVCGKSKTEEIAALEHTYATEWSHDASTHWHACTDEGYETLRADEAAHDFDEGIVTKEATVSEEGAKKYTCKTCGYEKITVIKIYSSDTEETIVTYSGNPIINSSLVPPDGLEWDTSLEDSQKFVWQLGECYAIKVSGNTCSGNIWVAASSSYLEGGVQFNTEASSSVATENALRFAVYLPKVNFTAYKSVSIGLTTNNAPYIGLVSDKAERIAFGVTPAVTTLTYTYNAETNTLTATLTSGGNVKTLEITDADVIYGRKQTRFFVYGIRYSQTHITPVTAKPLDRAEEIETLVSFTEGNPAEIKTEDGKTMFVGNGLYCVDTVANEYKWVSGRSDVFENGINVQTQSGRQDVTHECTVYLPQIDFTKYNSVSFKVKGLSADYIFGMSFGEEKVTLGDGTITVVIVYDKETGKLAVSFGEKTVEVTDADVVSGKKPLTFTVEGGWYGSIDISPIVNTTPYAVE